MNSKPPRRKSAKLVRDETGRVLCSCGCGRVPVKPRRTWFSHACVVAWKERNDPQTIRRRVFERDRGVCAICGRDANQAKRRCQDVWDIVSRLDPWNNGWRLYPRHLIAAWRRWSQARKDRWPERRRKIETAHATRMDLMKREGWPVGRRASWWEADHIIPVCEGGGQCGVDGYQTLCYSCHKKKTAENARHRAELRRHSIELWPTTL